MLAYAASKTDLSAIEASFGVCLNWRNRFKAARKESNKLLELVYQNTIKSPLKSKDEFMKRFKLTTDQW